MWESLSSIQRINHGLIWGANTLLFFSFEFGTTQQRSDSSPKTGTLLPSEKSLEEVKQIIPDSMRPDIVVPLKRKII